MVFPNELAKCMLRKIWPQGATMQRTTDILPEIQTEMVAANGLNFEVDMVGEGDHLIICLHGLRTS
jgi:hypothetical protein